MIFEDELIFVERETSEIPWVKIFTKTPFKELTDCDEATQKRVFMIEPTESESKAELDRFIAALIEIGRASCRERV